MPKEFKEYPPFPRSHLLQMRMLFKEALRTPRPSSSTTTVLYHPPILQTSISPAASSPFHNHLYLLPLHFCLLLQPHLTLSLKKL